MEPWKSAFFLSTSEIHLNPMRTFLTLYKDIFLSLSPFGPSVFLAPSGIVRVLHTGLPQNVELSTCFMTSHWHP